jgi:ATP-binding cassette subfamily F protein 3
MLQVRDVSKSFGDKLIFEKVSFALSSGERVGLIGPNGCGKTTLLKIILGEVEPDTGSARLSPATIQIGYLAQALEHAQDETVGQVMKKAIGGMIEAEQRLDTLSARMATAMGDTLERLLAEYDQVLNTFERLGGYSIEARAATVLAGLDLDGLDVDTPVEILSSGQRTRLGLARLLLASPKLLLLDEPTNHLDLGALEWLEDYLQRYEGALLIVSHDRAFLDATVSAILELDPLTHTVTEYPGTYSDYIEAKQQAEEKQWAAYKDQQAQIARLEGTLAAKKGYAQSIERGTIDFAPRKIAKGIARRAVVQQRRIQRLLDSEERIDKPQRSWQVKLEFENTPASGRDVLHLEGVGMGFGELELFRDVDLTLRLGERIALMGPNGSGKTTLARLILGELEPWTGRVRLGSGVKLGYYAQEQEGMALDTTPYEAIRNVAPMGQTETRSFLHDFLFSGDEVFVPVGSLSLGEWARLSLARLVAQGCNFLLLDEPINHLDIPSRSHFEQAIVTFQGAVLAIVHDRYFVRRFATGLWAIEGNRIRTYVDLEDMQRARHT